MSSAAYAPTRNASEIASKHILNAQLECVSRAFWLKISRFKERLAQRREYCWHGVIQSLVSLPQSEAPYVQIQAPARWVFDATNRTGAGKPIDHRVCAP